MLCGEGAPNASLDDTPAAPLEEQPPAQRHPRLAEQQPEEDPARPPPEGKAHAAESIGQSGNNRGEDDLAEAVPDAYAPVVDSHQRRVVLDQVEVALLPRALLEREGEGGENLDNPLRASPLRRQRESSVVVRGRLLPASSQSCAPTPSAPPGAGAAARPSSFPCLGQHTPPALAAESARPAGGALTALCWYGFRRSRPPRSCPPRSCPPRSCPPRSCRYSKSGSRAGRPLESATGYE